MKVDISVLEKARYFLTVVGDPAASYFAPFFYNAKYILVDPPPNPGFTFASDKNGNVYYAKEIPWEDTKDVALALYHEAGHFFLKHFSETLLKNLVSQYGEPYPGGGPFVLNLAGDMVINQWGPLRDAISKGKMEGILSPERQDPPMEKDQSVDYYYAEFMKRFKEQEKQQQQGGQGKDGEPGGQGGPGQQPKDNHGKNGQNGPGDGSEAHSHFGHGGCGSIADGGIKKDYETGPEKNQAELDAINKAIAEKIVEQSAKGIGNIPGGLTQIAKDYLENKVNWYKIVANQIVFNDEAVKVGRNIETYNRLKKRTIYGESSTCAFFPKRGDSEPRLTAILDTSGSMNHKDVSIGYSEIVGAAKTITTKPVRLITCDTTPHDNGSVTAAQASNKKLVGGRGGTDMQAALDMALNVKSSRENPTTLVLVTDGEIPELKWPAEHKKINFVVVVVNEKTDLKPPVPEWAKVINVSPKEYQERGEQRRRASDLGR